MYILAIETTGATASTALINEKGLVAFEESTEKLSHLQNLMTMTEKLLSKSKLSIDDISCIAVSEGPGSFTGIRIGVSTARALAQALHLKIISVPTLKAFVYNVEVYKGIMCPLFDARREQVYSGAYSWDQSGTQIIEKVKGDAYTLLELFEWLEKVDFDQEREIMLFGDAILAYGEEIEKWVGKMGDVGIKVILAPEDKRFQKASSVARLALALFGENKATDYEHVKPVYMRKAEAERKLEEGSLKGFK